ncbi:MAG: hypothetical protein COU66_02495 [Candidatus Pacebacteria bacterium CG10_big_fil_rev_8_21_14_0_10_44_11]|nr:MAG: hypothetical protein COU66_02495 [Candidatus Pacebacteria bacterium CG10_big_fil_rev_8_21_14_0_10_44_11]
MKHLPVSVICTTLNEVDSIDHLLESLVGQSYQPVEVITVDGGSIDDTVEKIKKFQQRKTVFSLKLIRKKGNRSVGRNTAISAATSNLIAITDAGCRPHKHWLEELVKQEQSTQAPVVAGYYLGVATSAFEEAVIPYSLVMSDQLDPKTFLPATRSMLLHKSVWQILGGFDERLRWNEDYPFAKKIKAAGYTIVFAKKAIVDWKPRKNIFQFARMIFRFAQGDIEAGIIRPKVIFIFVRYLILLFLLAITTYYTSWRLATAFAVTLFVFYSLWAIQKNSRYVKKGWYWLPVLQLTADIFVIAGSLFGTWIKVTTLRAK